MSVMQQQLVVLSSLECLAEMKEREREMTPRSVIGLMGKDVFPQHVICPQPRRMVVAPSTPQEICRYCFRPQSQSTLQCEGEPSCEILDIFLNKSTYGDHTNVNSSLPYFSGSPPSRADNPLVHDVQFLKKGIPPSLSNISQKSSCGSSFGANPSVCVEGFVSSSSESHYSVLMPA